jgi:hypothetical protein
VNGGLKITIENSAVLPSTAEFFYLLFQLYSGLRRGLINIQLIFSFMPKYGKKAKTKVKRAMHEMKRGKLKSGGSGKKVKSRKQAIAIGLSEARRAGGKVPRKKK